MNAKDYQTAAARTLINRPDRLIPPCELTWAWNAVNLCSETGLLAEHFKKGVFHQHGVKENVVNVSLKSISGLCRGFLELPFLPLPKLTDHEIMILWITIGLVGEAGEVSGCVLSGLISHNLNPETIKKELGDLLWYTASLCTLLNLDLGDVMTANIQKLLVRYPVENGYNPQDSQARVDLAIGD